MSGLLERVPPREVAPEAKLVIGLVSGSHFVNHMYLVLLPPVFGLLVTEFSVSYTQLGLAVGVLGLVSTVFQLPFGYFSDAYGRTITLGIGLGLCAVGVFTIAFSPTFAWLLVGQAIIGCGLAAHHPAHFPLIAEATAEAIRGKSYSVHGFAGNLGYAASPAITTAVLAFPGLTWRHSFLVMGGIGAVYAVVGVLVLGRAVSDDVTHAAPADAASEALDLSTVRQRVTDELTSIAAAPAILALAVLSMLSAIINWGYRSYAVVLLTDGYVVDLGTANTVLTALFVAAAVLMLVGGELTDRWRAGYVIVLAYSLLVVLAAAVATFLLPPVAAMAVIVLGGGSLMLGIPAQQMLVDKLSLRRDLGKNFAIITVGVSVGGAVAPPMFGAVIDTTGLGAAFLAVAGFGVVALVVVGAILRHDRSTRAARPDPGEG